MKAVSVNSGIAFRNMVIPALVAASAMTIAVIGAILVGNNSGIDGVNTFVGSLSGSAESRFGGLGILAPLGLAFGIGVAAAFNPCGFAMLPAYMGLYLGSNDEQEQKKHLIQHLGKALLVGGSVTAGIVVLFAAAGAIIGFGARSLVGDILPWLGLGIGIGLTIVGAWILAGGKLYSGLAQSAAARMGNAGQTNVKGYFLFGLSYGTASLSCTLSLFLSVIGTSFAVSSLTTSFGQFILFGMGMGLVITTLSVGVALFKGAMVGKLRKALPYIEPLGTWMMILAGSYIIFYWLTLGVLI